MNEQQPSMEGRIILTVLVVIGLWFGLQALLPKPPPRPASAPAAPAAPGDVAAAAGSAPTPALTSGPAAPAAGEASAQPEQRYPLSQPGVRAEFSSRGSFVTYELLEYQARRVDGASHTAAAQPVSLVPQRGPAARRGQLVFGLGAGARAPEHYAPSPGAGAAGGDEASAGDGQALTLHGANDQVAVTLRIASAGPFTWALRYALTNRGDQALAIQPQLALHGDENPDPGGFLAPSMDVLTHKCLIGADIEYEANKGIEQPVVNRGPVRWAGVDRQYFLTAVGVPSGPDPGQECVFASLGDLGGVTRLLQPATTLGPGEQRSFHFTAFLGPKRPADLQAAGLGFDESVDYNIWGIPLAFLCRPMLFILRLFHGWTGSWGLAIMMLTMVVKLVVLPVNHKSFLSMRAMQRLKPLMDDIKRRHPEDKEAQTREMLKLYQQHKVNPVLGGCLPALIQMPIYLALYRSLWSAVDLYQQPFLWVPDLTASEPFPFLALALGALMFLQQKVSPTMADSQQAKIMLYVMPVFMTVLMIALPSGLVLYILVNSILTIAHQLYINKRHPI